MAYSTARRMLFTRASLEPGQTVVVLGAAGGVGVACVQLAARAGCRVIACSSSDAKLARLRQIGAAETVNTDREVLRRRVRELTDGGAEVVVDFLGEKTWPESLRCVRRGGRLVTCGATTGYAALTDLRYVWSRELTIVGSDGWARTDLQAVVEAAADGELQPVIHAVFPLREASKALAALDERRVFGKIVVVPDRTPV